MIEILIVDDHPLVTDGIRTMLKDEPYFRITGTAKTAREALTFLKDSRADVVLLDINLPDSDGLRLCEQIRTENPDLRIIALTYINEAGMVNQMIRKGANGYLLKNMERAELIEALHKVLDGGIYLSPAANEKVLQQLRQYDLPKKEIPALTRREKEILELLASGLTSHEIAARLFLSNHTVDTHRKNMLQKFNVHNTQSLLNAVRELGIV